MIKEQEGRKNYLAERYWEGESAKYINVARPWAITAEVMGFAGKFPVRRPNSEEHGRPQIFKDGTKIHIGWSFYQHCLLDCLAETRCQRLLHLNYQYSPPTHVPHESTHCKQCFSEQLMVPKQRTNSKIYMAMLSLPRRLLGQAEVAREVNRLYGTKYTAGNIWHRFPKGINHYIIGWGTEEERLKVINDYYDKPMSINSKGITQEMREEWRQEAIERENRKPIKPKENTRSKHYYALPGVVS